MNTWFKNAASLVIACFAGTAVIAQDVQDKVKKDQEIIIRKSGDQAAKTTIVIDGPNITINGKPVDEYKAEGLTIFKRDGSEPFNAPHFFENFPRGGFKMFDEHGPMAGAKGNKALLGVVTESSDGGAKITEVSKESGAEKAGLMKDDVITKVGDRKIEGPDDLVDAISNYKPNDKINIIYKRAGKDINASVTLGENKSKNFSFNLDGNDLNINAPNIRGAFDFSRKPKIGLQIQDVEEGKGVKVQDVDENSAAAKAGLKEGDVITEINGKPVDGVDQVRTEIKDLKEGDTVKVKFNRSGSSQTVDIKLPKKLKTADL